MSQLHSSHPIIGSKPYVIGSHWSQFFPTTCGGQIHSPVEVSHVATDGQLHDLQSGNPKYPVLQT